LSANSIVPTAAFPKRNEIAMIKIRQQLSLYVPAHLSDAIENVRRIVDPIQSKLIPAHITLCREDELRALPTIKSRLISTPLTPITLRFGEPEGFSTHGWLLNCISGDCEFRALREFLLDSTNINDLRPHITLAHPRNPKSEGNHLSNIDRLPKAIEMTFPVIRLIEQQDNEPWRVIERYELSAETPTID
jgi:2'-5' RNA ligase